MPERKPSVIISDMLTCIEHIRLYTHDLSFDDFVPHYMAVEACLYNIQVIGEAVSYLPEDIKQSHPQIPWILIKGMRNRLIHEYFGTDLQMVWSVITDELPSFKTELEKIKTILKEEDR
jgi:uncharacterized protein with HEPN domain